MAIRFSFIEDYWVQRVTRGPERHCANKWNGGRYMACAIYTRDAPYV